MSSSSTEHNAELQLSHSVDKSSSMIDNFDRGGTPSMVIGDIYTVSYSRFVIFGSLFSLSLVDRKRSLRPPIAFVVAEVKGLALDAHVIPGT